jgi:hypothetical protein
MAVVKVLAWDIFLRGGQAHGYIDADIPLEVITHAIDYFDAI